MNLYTKVKRAYHRANEPAIERKRRLARGLHDEALWLATQPGRERHANVVSREAARLDAEVAQMSTRDGAWVRS